MTNKIRKLLSQIKEGWDKQSYQHKAPLRAGISGYHAIDAMISIEAHKQFLQSFRGKHHA